MIVMIVQRAGVEPANVLSFTIHRAYPISTLSAASARLFRAVIGLKPFMSRSLLPTGILKRIDQVATIQWCYRLGIWGRGAHPTPRIYIALVPRPWDI